MPATTRRPRAREDILDIWTYIAFDNVEAADAVVDRFDSAFALLAANPKMGQARPDIGTGVRSFVVGSYIVFYRPISGGIDVGRILHGRRNIRPEDIRRGFAGPSGED